MILDFLKKANEIHGNLFYYDLVKYKNALTKVETSDGITEVEQKAHKLLKKILVDSYLAPLGL